MSEVSVEKRIEEKILAAKHLTEISAFMKNVGGNYRYFHEHPELPNMNWEVVFGKSPFAEEPFEDARVYFVANYHYEEGRPMEGYTKPIGVLERVLSKWTDKSSVTYSFDFINDMFEVQYGAHRMVFPMTESVWAFVGLQLDSWISKKLKSEIAGFRTINKREPTEEEIEQFSSLSKFRRAFMPPAYCSNVVFYLPRSLHNLSGEELNQKLKEIVK